MIALKLIDIAWYCNLQYRCSVLEYTRVGVSSSARSGLLECTDAVHVYYTLTVHCVYVYYSFVLDYRVE